MEVPTDVLVYKVLKNAELSNEKQQLTQATVVFLTFENRKKQLKAIFDSYTSSRSSEDIDVKFVK